MRWLPFARNGVFTTVASRLPKPPRWLVRLLLVLISLSVLAAAGTRLLRWADLAETHDSFSPSEITRQTKERLRSIAFALDSTRDWLSVDPYLGSAVLAKSPAHLFPLLRERDSLYSVRPRVSALYGISTNPAQDREETNLPTVASHGFAVYSSDGKLLAWYSTGTSVFGFDTTLTGNSLLMNRDRGVILQNEPIYVYLLAIRKLVSSDGRVEGFIETRRQLAVKEPVTDGHAASFIDDIRDRSRRDVAITFGGSPPVRFSDSSLYGDPGDPSSYVGSLVISDSPVSQASWEYRMLRFLWILGLTIAIGFALVWLLIAVANPDVSAPATVESGDNPTADHADKGERLSARQPLVVRTFSSVLILGSLIGARILFSILGSFSSILGAAYQDPSDFASDWGFGIARDPLELFVTTVFATAAAVMFWIIWMPRKQLVRDDSRKKSINEIVRRERTTLLIFTIVAVLASQFLVDLLSLTVESIVHNGSLRYLTIKQVLPAPGMLMMMLSFLGIGVTYFFLTTLVLTFALRATIFMLPRRILLGARIAGGAIMLALMTITAVLVVDQLNLSDTSLLNRSALAGFILAVSLAVIIIDAFASDPTERTPSFLYKLPRSSRTILFILAASAIVMSPLVASKQMAADREIARRVVEGSSEVDTPELETVAAHVLATARERIAQWDGAGHDTATLRQTAFMVWLEGLREHQDWDAVIDVYDAAGDTQSHFATFGGANELHRIRPSMDSVLHIVRINDSASNVSRVVVPCFTASCTPAVAVALRCVLPHAHVADKPVPAIATTPTPVTKGPYFISVALWSDLPALALPRSRFNLLSGSAPDAGNDPLIDGGFIVAQYRPNLRRLTNTPSLDVPATLAPGFERLLRKQKSFWRPSEIGGLPYQTLYYRTAHNLAPNEKPSVITVSIPEPTFGKIMEFALRINAIGLAYGTAIVIILLIGRQIGTRRLRFTLKFRDRIFLIVLLIAMVPLVVVTNVTRSLLTDRASSEQQDRLSRDASVIKERVARQIEPTATTQTTHDLQTEVENLSAIIGREFSVYDPNGRLRASSRPEFYESGMLADVLNANVVEEVILGKRSFYTQPIRIGSETYEAGYQPVTSSDGLRLLGVIALATMDEQSRVEAEIARTTSLIYGTFAALGLVLLGIGALFAARVASPILALMRATERVAQGKLSTSIPVTREDEIGELMQAFNSMTRELEKSREIVAQTEREIAWKEMARQVAHEIKNPLTPMKLSVQHLEHAHEAKDPNFNSIFRRVIGTVSEQIDVLTRIATEFSRFGAMPRRKWGPVSLRRVADSAIALFDSDRSRIRFVVDVPKNLPMLHSDEDELRRAFVNLIRNAIQAIDGWGIIVLRATLEQGMILVRLSDTGGGMSEETLKRAFDPNFSTKTSGMGLGLAIVKKTITDMSGSIRVESKAGHGTTFYIDLPARGYVEEEDEV